MTHASLRCVFTVLMLSCLLAQPVGAQPVSQSVFGDASFWKTFDWAKAAESEVWRMPAWSDPTEQHDFDFSQEFRLGASLEKNSQQRVQDITINGSALELKSIDNYAALHRSYRFQMIGKGDETLCRSLFDWVGSRFGPGTSQVKNREWTPGGRLQVVDEVHQWQVGVTSVSLMCTGVLQIEDKEEPNDDLSVVLVYRALDGTRAILPLTSISCVGAEPRATDFGLILDESGGQILRTDFSLIASGKNVTILAGLVRWSADRGPAPKLVFELNRVTGRLAAHWQDSNQSPQLRWQCEKNDPGVRRF